MRRMIVGVALALVVLGAVWFGLSSGPDAPTLRQVTIVDCVYGYRNPPGDQSKCVPNTPEQQAKQDAEMERLRATR